MTATYRHSRHGSIESLARSANDTASSGYVKLAYNLFRHKDEVGLYCAVPQDRPVPTFLIEDKWDYARLADTRAQSGFDADAARASAEPDGFYLFGAKPSAS